MKRFDVHADSVSELVDRFAAICTEQGQALFDDEVGKYNRLFKKMVEIRDELKSRPGDQRRALQVLFKHPDLQVRLQAARATLAIASYEARRVIESIAASRRYPQAGDAGMCLWALDEGIFKPE